MNDARLIAANTTELPKSDPAPESSGSAASEAKPRPSQNVTINLINRLVQRGLLPKEDAEELIKQAEADAVTARTQAQVDADAAAQNAAAQATAALQAALAQNGGGSAGAAPLPPESDSVRVTYVPETVKAEIRDQIKQQVMAQAKNEGWASPHNLPEWVSRFRFMGDVRIRYEGDFFPGGNDNTGAFPNFNAINTGAPFDVSGNQFSPQLNVDKNRNRIRLRARLGVEADLGDGFTAGLRIATGESNTPVSTNQSFGLANQGQGGNFSKYAIWLDRAFLKYELGALPTKSFALTIGRFDNPFFRTSEIVWDDDLGFDGAAVQARYEVARGVVPFVNAGAFPIFNTDFNFSSNQPKKFKSSDKYLYGGQAGVDWRITKELNAKVAAAYYHFDNVEGQLSDPFTPLTASDQGNTDNTRPSFAQKGNSYFPLRRIVANSQNNFGTTNQFQYFGLATPFHVLDFSGQLDYTHFEPVTISLFGEFVKNVAFDRQFAGAYAVNNRSANGAVSGIGSFAGGDTGWIAGLKVGAAALQKRWDWQLGVNYRYVESDATVDGFTDSDFGLGGTNLKGYTAFGTLALSPRVSIGARYMSAQEIAGPPFKVDIFQVDLNGKF